MIIPRLAEEFVEDERDDNPGDGLFDDPRADAGESLDEPDCDDDECYTCRGTGEGMVDGSACRACRGTGVRRIL